MNTITSNSTVGMMTSISNNISTDIVTQTDSDSNDVLTIDELEIDDELFNSLDLNTDGSLTKSEIASAIDTQLSSFDEMPNPEEFASLLSDLGLSVPTQTSQTDDFASQLMSGYDTDGDSLLTSDEVSMLSDEEFSALDTDGDETISTEELSTALNEVSTEETEGSAPPAGGGAPIAATSEEDEEYDELDTNEDGVVSLEERLAGMGIDTDSTTSETSEETTSQDSIKMLMDVLKANSSDSEEDLDLNNFSNIMKMSNNQNDTVELNSYVNNLSDKNSSVFAYA